MTVATVIAALIAACAALATTILQIRQHKRVDEVHEQVKNSHTTNFREDMDLVIESLDHLKSLAAGLRRDLRAERSARIKLQELVDAELLRRRGSRVRQ